MANNTAQGKTLEKKGFKLPISGNALVLLIALVLVTAIFSALNPNYFTYGNFINILVSSTLIGLPDPAGYSNIATVTTNK